jgi:hypothetical protein
LEIQKNTGNSKQQFILKKYGNPNKNHGNPNSKPRNPNKISEIQTKYPETQTKKRIEIFV